MHKFAQMDFFVRGEVCMDKFPVVLAGEGDVGELTVEREMRHTCFVAQVCLPQDGLWCLWVVGDKGTLRLGVLEPNTGDVLLRRRFSEQLVMPIGKVVRGEIRPVKERGYEWEPVMSGEQVFMSAWLQKKLCGQGGMLRKRCGDIQYIAIPYDKCNAFTAVELFCFARLLDIRGALYLTLCFNEKEQVIFG